VKHFYGPDVYGDPPGMVRADNINHARQRKLVSHAFSDQALREQEPLLSTYAKALVVKLKEVALKPGEGKVDMVTWYNFTTFDIMVSRVSTDRVRQNY
jgi:cytochrome P450